MGLLDGKVAIVTGAGRGIGREEALLLAAEGAKVIVNDVGASLAGRGRRRHPAEEVVAAIKAAGGEAAVNGDDISSWARGRRTWSTRPSTPSGSLDILVNNAGILRDKMSLQHGRVRLGRRHPGPPEGPLRPDPLRRRPLAQPGQGGRGGDGPHHQHVVRGRPLRQRRPGQLRRRQGRYRRHDLDPRPRARALRRHRQRHRPPGPHPDDRGPLRRDGQRRGGHSTRGTPRTSPSWSAFLATDEAADVNGQIFVVFGGNIWAMGGFHPVGQVTPRPRLDTPGAGWRPRASSSSGIDSAIGPFELI